MELPTVTPSLAEIKAAAKESLSHTWSGREIPVGSSIPSAFRDAVRAEKANARNVLWLLSRVEELAEALRDVKRFGHTWYTHAELHELVNAALAAVEEPA